LVALPPKFSNTGVNVSNFERSIVFYRKALGMKLMRKENVKETGGRVAWLKSKGSNQVLVLNWYPRKYKHGGRSGLDFLSFEVRDAVDEYTRLSKDHREAIAPFQEGNMILAYVKDPSGNWIELGSKLRRNRPRQYSLPH
jgi:catechol 2,3-dioxygenase-like lactoylglutathione lyase family enzyme